MFTEKDTYFMREALKQAQLALSENEIAVGAVLVKDDSVISAGRNTREALSDPTGHAEINAIRAAAKALGTWRLDGCTLYVTLEPCCMCAGAIVQSRISRVVFGAYDEAAGCCGSVYRICEDPAFGSFALSEGGLLSEECTAVLKASMKRK